ncbi:hypothetical protein GGI42DRAFT_50029 [Trichoderma sp. SZMC 28013]
MYSRVVSQSVSQYNSYRVVNWRWDYEAQHSTAPSFSYFFLFVLLSISFYSPPLAKSLWLLLHLFPVCCGVLWRGRSWSGSRTCTHQQWLFVEATSGRIFVSICQDARHLAPRLIPGLFIFYFILFFYTNQSWLIAFTVLTHYTTTARRD